jgi:carbamoyltransferase
VANGRIVRESGFENVWIQPAAGDDGIAIGCAYYGYLEILGHRRAFVMDHAYVGKRYTDQDGNRPSRAARQAGLEECGP